MEYKTLTAEQAWALARDMEVTGIQFRYSENKVWDYPINLYDTYNQQTKNWYIKVNGHLKFRVPVE